MLFYYAQDRLGKVSKRIFFQHVLADVTIARQDGNHPPSVAESHTPLDILKTGPSCSAQGVRNPPADRSRHVDSGSALSRIAHVREASFSEDRRCISDGAVRHFAFNQSPRAFAVK